MYVRSRRIGVLGSILDLVRDHPGLDFAWITASHPTLCFDQKERWSDVCRLAHDRLQQDLERSRAIGVPGFVIACLNGYFDPGMKKFRVEYRGIVAGEKLKRIRAAANLDQNGERLRSRIHIVVHQIKDLQQQIAGVMPNFLPELVPLRTNSLSNIKRMRQPYHSIYLMWLDQQSLADMWVINGAFYSDGRLVMAECYQATAGQGMRSRRSPRVMRP